MTTILYTVLALLAFAGNSVLCRLALGEGALMLPVLVPYVWCLAQQYSCLS